jgi:hypothetical protein
MYKVCTCCKKKKAKTEKNFRRVSLKNNDMRFRQPCRPCEKIKLKQYDQSPQGKQSKARRDKNWRLSGGKAISDKKYYNKNKKVMIAKMVERRRKERISKPHVKMRDAIACLIRTSFRKKGNRKSERTEFYLGCTVDYFLEHIQKQFVKGMTLKNHGKWHIDHIKPCASFDLSKLSEQKKCFHYTNLQPLWAKDNLLKKDQIFI